ncbi:FtsK/SpoIIIE domain-containing protein [Yinghuangia seranimata]|uniref:FtsK/SpoIIIE domain-containing protein n=1 Tax=Yinghuangia seranimata TaxID=408067 RepID=UPI00248C67F2|nr:FtsK/SpoIIIE domain-containing protein [Yinghuangia seranimata]MDI2128753.1 FtsK/SpoIIIE domain-containing protein [Yinghuangia seranimata]
MGLTRVLLGRDESREVSWLRLSGVPGMTVVGLPGYGKTQFVMHLVGELAPCPYVQFGFIDGKGGPDYDDVADRAFAHLGDDLGAALELVEGMYELMQDRQGAIRAHLDVKNFWHVGPSRLWPLVVLVIDEAHTFFHTGRGVSRADQEAAHKLIWMVEQLVKKGRSVGFFTVLLTQKGTGDAIPTQIRDVCPAKVAFAVATMEAADAGLGSAIRLYPDAHPIFLQDPKYIGVATTALEGRKGFARVRIPQVDEQHVAQLANSYRHLATEPRDLFDLACGVLDAGGSVLKPVFEGTAA